MVIHIFTVKTGVDVTKCGFGFVPVSFVLVHFSFGFILSFSCLGFSFVFSLQMSEKETKLKTSRLCLQLICFSVNFVFQVCAFGIILFVMLFFVNLASFN